MGWFVTQSLVPEHSKWVMVEVHLSGTLLRVLPSPETPLYISSVLISKDQVPGHGYLGSVCSLACAGGILQMAWCFSAWGRERGCWNGNQESLWKKCPCYPESPAILLVGVPRACIVLATGPSMGTEAFKGPCWKSGHIRIDLWSG